MKKGFAALALLLSACAPTVTVQKPRPVLPHPDLSLLRSWSPELQAKEKFEAPFVATFERDGVELRFVAAAHGGGAMHPTHRTVLNAFRYLSPEVVIIEGQEYDDRVNPEAYGELARRSCAPLDSPLCSEPRYAALLATQRGAEYAGGEPPRAEVVAHFLKIGRTVEDYLGLRIVENAIDARRKGLLRYKSIETLTAEMLDSYREDISISHKYDFAAFKAWYKEKTGKPFDLDKIDSADAAPLAGPGATALNLLAADVDAVREASILSVIDTMVHKHDRVLVVYGATHLVKQRKVLEKMFGASVDRKPY